MSLLGTGIFFSVVFYIGKLRSEITELKQGEVEIRKLSQAIKYSSATIVITDTKGKIEYVNPKFTQLTGYSLEETIGKNPRILISGKTPPEVFTELWSAITSGNEWKGRFCNRKKDGELYWEYASIFPVKDTKGVITNFIAVKDEITERYMMKETLLQSEKLKSLGTITAGITHDFNNILAIISGSTQMLEMDCEGNKDLMDTLHIINKASDDGAGIVHRMRAFTKQDESPPVLRPVDINGVLRQTVEFVKPRWMNIAKAGGVDYDIDVSGVMKVAVINGNESELREVLINIMNNSLDAMPEGGRLSFLTWHDEENIFVSVSDTGVGMSEEVKSEVVKGTTFTLRLPIGTSSVDKIELPKENQTIKAKGLRILVVDDMKDIRTFLKRFFVRNGHAVTTVESGNMAIEVLKTESFDLVLCDLVMPGVSGHKVVEVLNMLEKKPKIGVMTGWSEKVMTEGVGELNVDFIIKKSY